MIRILTVEREYGSGAANISATLAHRLGWKLWDKEITEEIARRLRCKASAVAEREERVDSMFYRMIKVFMRGSFEPRTDTAGLELLDAESLAGLFGTVITEIGEKGNCVIVGRGAAYFLRDRKDVFNLFLYAPYEEKLRRTIAQSNTPEQARQLLESVDRERAAFIHKYYNKEWPDRHLYSAMINTTPGDDYVVESVLHEINLLNKT
jgi:cytidylate kinase